MGPSPPPLMGLRGVVEAEIIPELGHIAYQIKADKLAREYDQEIPQSQTADNPMALQVRAAQPSRDTRKTN